VRHLYTALAGRPPLTLPTPGGTPAPTFLPEGAWTLPTLGGAGGQSIAGAISTGTHGGDVARPPLSDAVLAMLIVGEGGELSLVQRPAEVQVVDVPRLSAELTAELGELVHVTDLSSSNDILDAAVVSVGRFGIVYAYVLEIVNEAGKVMIEDRTPSTWNNAKARLLMDVADAVAHDQFFQLVINPHQRSDSEHTCYTITHRQVNGDPTSAGPPPLEPVISARQSSSFVSMMQNLCSTMVTPQLLNIQRLLTSAAIVANTTGGIAGIPVAILLLKAAESIGRIGPDHLLGDAVVDVLNLVTDVGFPGIVEIVTAALLDGEQRTPWSVKGTRFDIADFFDYEHDCYRGDSVELFFEVDNLLAHKIDMILEVFKELRGRGLAIGAYVSIRFMARSRALLGLARWDPSCSVEIAMLRGLHGNSEALNRLQEVALNNGGYVHWGQQNDLSQRQVEARFGSALDQWRVVLEDLETSSMLFSTPFTRQHGLEVPLRDPNWTGWQRLNLLAQSSPCVVSAWNNQPLEIFSQNSLGVIVSRKRPSDGSDNDWAPVHNDHVKGAPVALRGNDGRIELFVLFLDQRIKHCWQEGQPGGQWSSWDTLGFLDIGDIDGDPSVVAHYDGRFELFARGGPINNWQLFNCWTHWTSGAWSNFAPRGSQPIISTPSACHRVGVVSDQIVVVAADGDGRVLEKHQIGASGDSGWSEWTEILPRGGPSLGAFGGGSPIAVDVVGTGATVHVLAFDNQRQLRETLEEANTIALSWGSWHQLPLTEGLGRLDPGSRLATVQTDRLYLFGMSLRGELFVCEFHPGIGWREWQSLGGEFTGNVAAGVHADGRIEVVARAKTDQLMARRQTSPAVW
jgi:hypothetical protein